MRSPRRADRRGVALLLVLIAVTMCVILTVGFLAAHSTTTVIADNVNNHARARAIAESAMALTIREVQTNTTWRTDYSHGTWATDQQLMGGTYTITGEDGQDANENGTVDGDADLSDDETEFVTLTVIGKYQGASHTVRTVLSPGIEVPIIAQLLLVTPDAASLTAEDQARKLLFRSWGFDVTPISASASQAAFDAAFATNDVAYLSEEISDTTLSSKCRDAPIGLVSEEGLLNDTNLLATGNGTEFNGTHVKIANTTHYITRVFSAGNLKIVKSGAPLRQMTGTIPAGATTLATRTDGSTPTLAAYTRGAQLTSGTARGRRIVLPVGGDSFSIGSLTDDGKSIVERALRWAAVSGVPKAADVGVFAGGWIEIVDNGTVDSFDSSLGLYDPVSNAGTEAIVSTNLTTANQIRVTDTATLKGSAYCGPGGDPNSVVQTSGSGAITGIKGELDESKTIPPATVPSGMPASEGDLTLSSGTTIFGTDRHFNNLYLRNNAILKIQNDITIVLDGMCELSDTSRIELDPGSIVTWYASRSGGDAFHLEHDSQANMNTGEPDRFKIYVLDDAEMDMDERAKMYARTIAPRGNLDINDDCEYFGTYVGDSITVEQNGQLHHDLGTASVDAEEDPDDNTPKLLVLYEFNEPTPPAPSLAYHWKLDDAVMTGGAMAHGTYVGNNSDGREITDPGFQPDVVIIKADKDDEYAVCRTSTMSGDNTKRLGSDSALTSNRVQSLTAAGFTVGTNDEVNDTGTDYYWMAFQAVPGAMKVGSYTGNGNSNRDITGLGFQPAFVIVMRQDDDHAYMRSSQFPDDRCQRFNDSDLSSSRIEDMRSDGFRVDSDNDVNGSGNTYHYIAWKAIPGQMAVGRYAGDGADPRSISGVGFQPDYLIIANEASEEPVHRSASVSGDDTLEFESDPNDNDRIQAFESDGFEVGNHDSTNDNGYDFYWMAFKGGGSMLQAVDEVVSVNGSSAGGVTAGQAGYGDGGDAFGFDGTVDYVTIPHDAGMLMDQGTIAFWFKASSLSGTRGLFSKDSNGRDQGGQIEITTVGSSLNVKLESATADYTAQATGGLSTGVWHHAAVTWGPHALKLYLDGAHVQTVLYVGGLGTTSGGSGNVEPIVLGASSSTSGDGTATPVTQFFAGDIDDVRLYNRALSSDQVTNLHGGLPLGPSNDPSLVVADTSGFGTSLDLNIEHGYKVSWVSGGGLEFTGATKAISASAASKLYDAMNGKSALTIAVKFTPGNLTQSGPASIFSYSSDASNRNFTFGQVGDDYSYRLRTSATSNNGTPEIVDANVLLNTTQAHYAIITWNGTDVYVYRNGTLDETVSRSGTISNWTSTMKLMLGNEADDSKPWLGTLHRVAVYDRFFNKIQVKNVVRGKPPGDGGDASDFSVRWTETLGW